MRFIHRDVDYIVQDGSIVIVDEFTGRTMPGRRWSEGLHQAIEAKEGVSIQHENQTIASITFQNYFRLYNKLAGMTGTADTEAFEFQQIYGLEVVVVPTNKPMIREDFGDLIYLTATGEKFDSIIEDINDCVSRGQPVLVGTTSVETSEYLSGRLLDKVKIKHQILNAKQHEREAKIIADAGLAGNGDHCYQHGRSRHRYRARRQSGGATQGNRRVHQCGRTRAADPASGKSATTRLSPPAGCTSSAPSVTNRGASITSYAVARGVRVIRVRHAFTCRWKTA